MGLVLGATLTLLGLIIGFTFSMAISRYEQRKNYEEAEANAIGTEYVRADLLPAADAQRVRTLLANYTDQRILFYRTGDAQQLSRVNADTAQLQTELWSTVVRTAHHAANTHYRTGRFRHERCVEFSGIYTGRLVEPYPTFSMGPHVYDRSLLQSADRLLHSPHWYGIHRIYGSDPGGVDLVLSHRRHRQPPWWHHSGDAAKSCEPLSVASSAIAGSLMRLRVHSSNLSRSTVAAEGCYEAPSGCKRFTRLC